MLCPTHPLFTDNRSGHGRVETRELYAFPIEPLAVDFPFARALIVVRSQRMQKKSGLTTTESRYYLSSAPPDQYSPQKWLDLIRGHWGGAEIRNHWRRDVLMGEDRSRSHQPNLLANLALIRNALLSLLSERLGEQSLAQFGERFCSSPKECLAILAAAGTPKQITLACHQDEGVHATPSLPAHVWGKVS
nr:ISAs1 family transposase [Verrucomicrobium sp. 3C]